MTFVSTSSGGSDPLERQPVLKTVFERSIPMADSVRKVAYCNTTVSSRAGQGAKVLAELKKAGVNLTAFTGFPTRGGKAQLDFVTQNMAAVRRVARKNGWRLSRCRVRRQETLRHASLGQAQGLRACGKNTKSKIGADELY
jgi:hypothetical protein